MRVIELYRESGVSEVIRGIRDYFAYKVDFRSEYQKHRVDNEIRWKFISQYIDGKASMMDIGCAEGYFVKHAADHGVLSIGIERDTKRLVDGGKMYAFMDLEVNPRNIKKLPEVDVILLLTVHHHWAKEYGIEKSIKMIDILTDKCNTFVYEPPGDRDLHWDKLSIDDSVEYYSSLLEDRLEILDSKVVPYQEGEREDPIFVCTPK